MTISLAIRSALLMAMAVTGQAVFAQAPASAPAVLAEPAQTTTAPAEPAVEPQVERLLERMEQAGQEFRSLSARVEYVIEDVAFADRETRTGRVFYQGSPRPDQPDRFRVSFETLQAGTTGPRVREEVDYVFDGYWLTTRKPRLRQMIRYQVGRPGEPVADAMKLGEGPFPMPFGQEKRQVLANFTATTRPLRPGEPAQTQYLRLVPRQRPEEGGMAVREIEMWVDDRGLPVRIRSVDDQGTKISLVRFEEIDPQARFEEDTFTLPRPPRDWEYRIEPLRDAGQIQP